MTQIFRGLDGIAVTETRLSRVDGEAGELVIGGFPLNELAPRARFEETLFLLWNDRLPSPKELDRLQRRTADLRSLAPATLGVLRSAAAVGVEPMDALRMGVATLGLAANDLHTTELHTQPREANQARALRLVAAMPSIVAAYARLRRGLEPVDPDPALGHAENYLAMLSGDRPHPAHTRALETYLNTAVDHGMNASTFTARVISSTRSCMASAVAGALGALKGPLHGGAPGPALDMVFAVRRQASESGRPLAEVAEAWVRDALARGQRMMGFGHRVYRVRDPRADVLGSAAEQLYTQSGNPLYADARAVEQVVLRVLAELKPGRALATNVEFYTALLLHGLELPTPLFTPTFAIARVGGWTAHVLEQIGEDRLIRPRVAYAGELDRHWQALESRPAA